MNRDSFLAASEAIESAVVEIADARYFAERNNVRAACGLLLGASLKVETARDTINTVADDLAAVSDGLVHVGMSCFTNTHEAVCDVGLLLDLALTLPGGLSNEERGRICRQQLAKLGANGVMAFATPEIRATIRRERAKVLAQPETSKQPTKRIGRRPKVETDAKTKVLGALKALLRECSQDDPPTGKKVAENAGVANASRFIRIIFGSQAKFEAAWRRGDVRPKLARLEYSPERHTEYVDNHLTTKGQHRRGRTPGSTYED